MSSKPAITPSDILDMSDRYLNEVEALVTLWAKDTQRNMLIFAGLIISIALLCVAAAYCLGRAGATPTCMHTPDPWLPAPP